MELKRQLKEMIVKEMKLTNVSPEEINDDEPLFGSDTKLGLDSLDAVELVVLIQKNFKVDIGDRNTASEAFASISKLADYIAKNRPAS